MTEQTRYVPSLAVENVPGNAIMNSYYRKEFWTGKHLQMTLMSIPCCSCIGLELHPDTDQIIRVEQGFGLTEAGSTRDNLCFQRKLRTGDTVFVPAGTWHNVMNTENFPLRLSAIYGPPNHPRGTVHETKAEADMEEH